uniref:Ionotropic glutamate receptor C-terminal domain-containing protein n=1 Tax=Glossina austeni TaxID=7395 RepID=A0A1A9V1S3_GLOAU
MTALKLSNKVSNISSTQKSSGGAVAQPNRQGYGIATPKGSPWRDKISLAILELQEKGDIQMLYDKWWKSVGETCFPRSNTKQSKANALGFDNIGKYLITLP